MSELANPLPRDASPEQRLNLRHLRERTYLPDDQAPYHGISHPDKVWSNAEVLMERCAAYSIPVDGDALRNAIELHDALSHLPPNMLGHESAESVAAEVTYRFLKDCGYSEEAAVKIKNIVMATNPEVRPASPEEIIIRAADLWNIGATFNEFREGSFALHQEAQLARRKEIPFANWMRGAFIYLERFMWPMLELTPESKDTDGRSVFYTNALRNMSTLWKDTFGEHTPISVEFFPSGSIRPTIEHPHEFYIAIHPEEQERKGSLARLAEDASAIAGAAFAVPGTRGAFPLPDEYCSRVVCHDHSRESLVEALRITSRGGTVALDLPERVDPGVMEIASLFECSLSERSPDGASHKRLTITKEAHL